MPYKHFIVWNTLGAFAWVTSMVLVGTLLGGIPGIAKNIELLAIVIVAVSVIPVIISILQKRAKAKKQAAAAAVLVEASPTQK